MLDATQNTQPPTMAQQPIAVKVLDENLNPDPKSAKAHHVGNPPAGHFKNPWPSAAKSIGFGSAFSAKFGQDPEKNNVPIPQGPHGARSEELVKVRRPDWATDKLDRLRATWIGHASFLVETPAISGAGRGVRVLFDPVFSERTSPVGFMGPKRYTPTPCSIDELPEVDIVCISHNHYDHLDVHTVNELQRIRKDKLHFLAGLNTKQWFEAHVCPFEQVTELDWWQACEVNIEGIGSVKLTCLPCQHASRRSYNDGDKALWCSWALEACGKKLYFAGDTAYQAVDAPSPCPAFIQIGEALGPFDMALLPIGLFKPQTFMGGVHSSPEQSLEIHKEIKSKLSLGMHYGTFRGGISQAYEDVREPPRRWREAAEKEGLWLGGGVEGQVEPIATHQEGVGLCDIGETVAV